MEAEFLKNIFFSSYRLPKQQTTTFGFQGILRVNTMQHPEGQLDPVLSLAILDIQASLFKLT
jgi:hypothetical protein